MSSNHAANKFERRNCTKALLFGKSSKFRKNFFFEPSTVSEEKCFLCVSFQTSNLVKVQGSTPSCDDCLNNGTSMVMNECKMQNDSRRESYQ